MANEAGMLDLINWQYFCYFTCVPHEPPLPLPEALPLPSSVVKYKNFSLLW